MSLRARLVLFALVTVTVALAGSPSSARDLHERVRHRQSAPASTRPRSTSAWFGLAPSRRSRH